MYSQEKQFSSLAKVLSAYDRVIIDTCSAMDEGFPKFMDTLVGSKRYWKKGLQIIIPKECIEELEKHAANNDWHVNETRIDAIRALGILNHAKRWHRVITIQKKREKKGHSFADPVILATATVLRIHYRVLVITQDKKLAADLTKLNNLGSQSGRFLAVMRINSGGALEGTTIRLPAKVIQIETQKAEAQAKKKAEEKPENSAKPTQNKEVLQQPTPKQETPSPAPKKAEPKPKEVDKNRPFYEFGPTPTEAIIASAKRVNVLVRDPGIAYVKEAHGPVDVTRDEIAKALPSKGLEQTGQKANLTVKRLQITVEKTERDFKASVTLGPEPKAEPVKTVPSPLPKEEKKEAAKPAKKKKAPAKKAEPAKAEVAPKVEAQVKADAPKKAEPKKKPAAPKQPAKKEEPTKEAVAKKPAAPKKTNIEKALLLEKRLSANISNPNYPNEKKAKDIDAFVKLYTKLSDDEKAQIKLSKDALLKQKESL